MSEKKIKKTRFDGKEVEILGETYEAGVPVEKDQWRSKMDNRAEKLKYLKSSFRYWYSDDVFGSERRKTKA